MKKLILSLLMGLLICFNQAQAASFSLTANDDAYFDVLPNKSVDNGINLIASKTYNSENYHRLGLLKFVATPEMMTIFENEPVVSMKLRMYLKSSNTDSLKVFYNPDNSWNENMGTYPDLTYDNTKPIGNIDTSTTGFTTTDIDYLSVFNMMDIYNPDSDTASFILDFNDTDFDKTNDYIFATFPSKESPYYDLQHAPTLLIETAAAPVPEPSSVLLGLLGLSGALGLRKARKSD